MPERVIEFHSDDKNFFFKYDVSGDESSYELHSFGKRVCWLSQEHLVELKELIDFALANS